MKILSILWLAFLATSINAQEAKPVETAPPAFATEYKN
jgi:hypothetical protein